MKCKVDFCDRDAKTVKHGVCAGHDYQRKQGKPFTPLRQWKRADIGVPGWRKCTACDNVKKDEEFYRRKNGTLRANCKACHMEALNGG